MNIRMKRLTLIVSGKIQKTGYIQNTLIKVNNIKSTFGNATGEFSGFSKLVKGGETNERLDTAATLLKEEIKDVKNEIHLQTA